MRALLAWRQTVARAAGVIMDPTFSDEDVKDAIRAIRKVYLAMGPA
jgi:hypothetical protein